MDRVTAANEKKNYEGGESSFQGEPPGVTGPTVACLPEGLHAEAWYPLLYRGINADREASRAQGRRPRADNSARICVGREIHRLGQSSEPSAFLRRSLRAAFFLAAFLFRRTFLLKGDRLIPFLCPRNLARCWTGLIPFAAFWPYRRRSEFGLGLIPCWHVFSPLSDVV